MLKKIMIALSLIVAILLIIIARQPSDFRITRSATIAAPSPIIFDQVNDFRRWNDWSPWAKLDPNAKNSFEGPSFGVGSVFKWSGNKDVGEGIMTIEESQSSHRIKIKLEFLEPFAATNATEFTFLPQGNETLVSWSMSGQNNFIAKAMGLVIDCDKMVGDMFEKGLANLKSISERN